MATQETADKKPSKLLSWTNRIEKVWVAVFAALTLYELTLSEVPIPANLILAATVATAGAVVIKNIENYKKTKLTP